MMRSIYRHIAWLFALENAAGIVARLALCLSQIGSGLMGRPGAEHAALSLTSREGFRGQRDAVDAGRSIAFKRTLLLTCAGVPVKMMSPGRRVI